MPLRRVFLACVVLPGMALLLNSCLFSAQQATSQSNEIRRRFDSVNRSLDSHAPLTPYRHDTRLDSIVRIIDSEKAAGGY